MNNRGVCLLTGLGLGAGLIYLLDPQYGRRRRAMLMDQLNRLAHETESVLGVVSRDLSNRTRGVVAEARSLVTPAGPVSDDRLRERIRAHMGRVVSHPRAIRVDAHDGHVTLSGKVLEHELHELLGCVRSVAGVKALDNHLTVRKLSDHDRELQGGRPRPGMRRLDVLQTDWSPATRALVGLLGGATTACAATTMNFPTACIVGTAGLVLLAAGLSNTSVRRAAAAVGERVEAITSREPEPVGPGIPAL